MSRTAQAVQKAVDEMRSKRAAATVKPKAPTKPARVPTKPVPKRAPKTTGRVGAPRRATVDVPALSELKAATFVANAKNSYVTVQFANGFAVDLRVANRYKPDAVKIRDVLVDYFNKRCE